MMIPKDGVTTHPEETLLEEFLKPMEIPQTRFAEKLGQGSGSVFPNLYIDDVSAAPVPVPSMEVVRASGETGSVAVVTTGRGAASDPHQPPLCPLVRSGGRMWTYELHGA